MKICRVDGLHLIWARRIGADWILRAAEGVPEARCMASPGVTGAANEGNAKSAAAPKSNAFFIQLGEFCLVI